MQIYIIGLGYVGLTLGVYLARKGLRVHGVEVSDSIIDSLNKKKAHFFEENFDIELNKAIDDGDFTFGHSYLQTKEKSLYIITVGTPLTQDGKVNLQSLKTVAGDIRKILKEGDIIILRSTVKIGVTREVVKQELDMAGVRYHLGFCPERTLEGVAFEELASLPQVISGIDKQSLDAIYNFFKSFCSELVILDSVEEAEMVKLLNNAERDLRFAIANEVAMMCDIKDMNAYKVIEAANYRYPRTNLKRPGLVGGPCLEKDPYILTESFLDTGYTPILFKGGRAVNENVVDISLKRVFDAFDNINTHPPKKIAILGFAFKGYPETGDMRGSLVYSVIETIRNRYPYVQLVGHDYIANSDEMKRAGVDMNTNLVKEAVSDSNMIIIQNNHPSYKKEPWSQLSQVMSNGAIVYDFWKQLSNSDFNNAVDYLYLGGK